MASQGPPNPPGDKPRPTTLAATSGRAHDSQTEINDPAVTVPVVSVVMQPAETQPPVERGPMPLWIALRDRRTDFDTYTRFVNAAFANLDFLKSRPYATAVQYLSNSQADAADKPCRNAWLGYGLNAYELLKTATEVFLLLATGPSISKDGPAGIESEPELARVKKALTAYLVDAMGTPRLPYIQQVIDANISPGSSGPAVPFTGGVFVPHADCPSFLELIWSYWHEEGMLVQSLNALSMRFRNRRISDGHDPLAHLEISPLSPLASIFWGYVQDEQHRLSLAHRCFGYEGVYGFTLRGKAVPTTMRIADRRSNFIESLHNLLHRCGRFFRDASNLQFNPDPFPLLNGLKEVHLVLSQGAGNQFAHLTWTARVEMLMQQWILARPEIGEFLGRRPMVVYPEAWMGNAETLKTMMGWADTSIVHFHSLAVFGERLLASIRWHAWGNETDAVAARDWAIFHRPEIQGYMEAYRVATRIDLTVEPKDSQATADRNQIPSVLLERKLLEQRRNQRKA